MSTPSPFLGYTCYELAFIEAHRAFIASDVYLAKQHFLTARYFWNMAARQSV